MQEKIAVTKTDLIEGLQRLGVSQGDSVLVHSSLRSFGHVEGGAETVVDTLLETVGESGTVAMPAFTWDSFHDGHGLEFDVLHTPSECGAITEALRRWPGALRGPHLCHSVAAVGAHADELVGDTASPYGAGSAFERLLQLDAWNLFLGVNFSCCTLLHLVEERALVPYRQHRDYSDCTVIHSDGRRAPSIATEYLRKPGFTNDFHKMNAHFAGAGIVRENQVGNATLKNARMNDIVEATSRYLQNDILFLLADDCRGAAHAEQVRGL